MRSKLWLLLVFLAVLPACGKDATLADVFSGKAAPLTVAAKELTTDWQCLTITKRQSGTMGMLGLIAGMESGMPAVSATYYTRGDTLVIDGETFLMVYQFGGGNADMSSLYLLMRHGENVQPEPERFTVESTLSLTLINVRDVNLFDRVRAFDPAKEFTTAEPPVGKRPDETMAAVATVSIDSSIESSTRLRQLATAVQMYIQDNNGVFPPLQDAAAMRKAIMPYLGESSMMFICPITNEHYLPNPILSGKKEAHITDPASMVVVYEPGPAPDGTRGVGFCDGHVKRIQEAEWPRLKQACKIQ